MRCLLLKMKTAFALGLVLVILVLSVSVFAGDGAVESQVETASEESVNAEAPSVESENAEAANLETGSGEAGTEDTAAVYRVLTETEGSGSVFLVTEAGEPAEKMDFPEGEKVYFKVLPSEGHTMRAIWIKDAFGADVVYSLDDAGSFIMPAADTLIRVAFEEVKKAEVIAGRMDGEVTAEEISETGDVEGPGLAEPETGTAEDAPEPVLPEPGDSPEPTPANIENESLAAETQEPVEAGSGAGNEAGSEAEEAAGTGSDAGNEAEEAVETGSGAGSEAEKAAETGSDAGNEADEAAETGPDAGNETVEEAASAADTAAADKTGEAPEQGNAPGSVPEAEVSKESEAVTKPDNEAGSLQESAGGSDMTVQAEAETTAKSQKADQEVKPEEADHPDSTPAGEQEEDPYFISEAFDYGPYMGLDYSTMRLIVGINAPDLLADESVVISSLNGLYLLQFTDVETTMKAYVYYLLHAPMVEIDGKVMAVNQEESQQGDFMGSGIMTEGSNPFVQAQEAVYETGNGAYDIALIDTGANGFVTNAVSVTGDYAGDDNGHGAHMAQLIMEQNPGARILSIKAFEGDGMADLSAIFAAFQYALTQNVRIISISATALSTDSSILVSAIESAIGSGCMVVASAGNNGRDASWFVPAGLPGVITIGACDETGVRLPDSNYGPCVKYNVTAGSTSEAAAKFSGWLSANSLDEVQHVLNQGLIYQTDFDPAAQMKEDDDPILQVFLELLHSDPSMDAVDQYLQQLTAVQAQNLYLDIPWEEMQTLIQLYADYYEQEHDTDTALRLVSQRMKERFYLDYFVVTTMDGEIVTYDQAGGTSFRGGEVLFGDNGSVSAGCYGMNTSSGHFYAFCALSSVAASPNKSGTANVISNGIITKIYLVSPSGPYYSAFKGEIFDGILGGIKNSNAIRYAAGTTMDSRDDQTKDYVLAHVMISGMFSGDWGNDQASGNMVWNSSHYAALQNAIARIDELIPDDDPYMQNAKTAWMNPSASQGHVYQSMLWVEANYGFLNLKKASSAPEAGYSIEGAVYEVYNAENTLVGTLTTDVNGDTESLFLPAGSYSVIEKLAPANYQVDTEVHSAAVEMYETTTLEVIDILNPPKGKITIRKTSANASVTNGNPNYTLEGAVYGLYTNAECTAEYARGTTNGSGVCTFEDLPMQTYYIRELSPSGGYMLDASVKTVEVNSDAEVFADSAEPPVTGGLKLVKASADTSITNNNSSYSLAGAVYGVYKDRNCTSEYAKGTTDANGSFTITGMPLGTYYVKEISASKGYQPDSEVKTVNVTSKDTVTVRSAEPPIVGKVSLSKVSAAPSVTNNHPGYSLAGAEYGIYRNAACTDLYKTITTNSSGAASADQMPLGTYYIRENKASAGYDLADCHDGGAKLHTVTLSSSNTSASVTCREPVKALPIQVLLQKVDEETGKSVPQGAGTFQGAEYTVKYYTNDQYSGSPERTWVFVTDASGKAGFTSSFLKNGSSPLYLSTAGTPVIPRGSFTVEETKVPAGYKKDPVVHKYQVNGSSISADADESISPVGTTPALQINKGVVSEQEGPVRGGVKVTKLISDTSDHQDGNVDVSGIRFAVVLSAGKNQKSVYVPANGREYQPGQVVAVITTNAEGVAKTGQKDLPYGYYDIYELSKDANVSPGSTWTAQETAAPGKLANNTGVLYNALHTQIFVNADNNYQAWNIKNDVVFGYVRILKHDGDREANKAQGDASLEGIRYAVVNRSNQKVSYPAGTENGTVIQPGSVVDVLATNAKGQITSDKLPYGKYDVVELRADAVVTKGTAFRESGSSVYANQKGYLYKARTVTVTVSSYGVTYDAVFTDPVVRGGVRIQKVLEELDAAEVEGIASLAGVTFSVVNASDDSVYVNGQWFDPIQDKGANGYTRTELLKAAESGSVIVASMTTDAGGQASLGAGTLPYGTYYIYEEKANASLQIDPDWVLRIEVREDGKVIDASSQPAKNPLVRGDLNFKKVDIDGAFRPNIPFLITAYDAEGNAVESHVIVSDANGDIDTAARVNTNHTNGMDAFVSYDAVSGQYAVTEEGEALLASGEAAAYGIWFSQGLDPKSKEPTGHHAPATDSRGALYYGYYRIFEIKCADNEEKGEDLLKSPMIPVMEKTSELDAHGRIVSESSDNTVHFRTFVDLEAGLASEAVDTTTGTHVAVLSHEAAFSDTIHYTHLKADSVYKWVVDFVLTDHPSTILSEVVADGYVPARSSSYVQTAEGTFTVSVDGTISGDFTGTPSVSSTGMIDTTLLEGREVSAIVYLYVYTEGYDFESERSAQVCNFITSHNTDVTDRNEMIFIPSMKTAAADPQTGDHVGAKSTEGEIVDTVTMTGLIPGGYYMLEETVIDRDTGKAPAGVEPVTKTFYSGWSSYGAIPLLSKTMPAIRLDSSVFEEKTLTIYESLWRVDDEGQKLDEQPVMIHEDPLDEEQSIHYINIDTSAADTATGDHVGQTASEDKGTACVKDIVHVSNMIPGMEYTIKGRLVYKKDCTDRNGTAHTAGEEIPALEGSQTELTFIAQDDAGIFTILYIVDASALEGLSVVSTEYAYHNHVEVAVHADLEDEDQTVHFPKIRTSLHNNEDEEHDAFPDTVIVLTDTVTYENLVPGLPYTLTGELYDQASGEKALDDDGKEITAQAVFTPQSADGTQDLTFTFPGKSMAGSSLVAFETLFHNEIDVARHQDLEDEEQTVHIPKIATALVDPADEAHDALGAETMVLTDHVTYENLLPGREYVVQGVLMDQETNEKALDDNGEEIKAQTAFTPQTEDGIIDVVFTFHGLSLRNHTVVAFEDLYRNERHVAVHADIEDEAQMIYVPEITTDLKDPADGEPDVMASEHITLTDQVSYHNLFPGQEYTVTGTLMDQASGEPMTDDNGERITADKTFVPKEKDGAVEITFTFSAVSLKGKTVVAFEELYHNDKKVAVHTDIEDEAQTVHFPEIRTTLLDSANEEHDVMASNNITLIDHVAYENLLPGMEYTLTGVLMDQETGEALLDENGQKITAGTTFTAKKTHGIEDVTFSFNGVSLAGHTAVAFEELYREEKKLAVHADLHDNAQTVRIPEITTDLKDHTDGEPDTMASEQVTLTDTVTYKNLYPGQKYKVTGILMDQASKQPVLDDHGKEIKAETFFTPGEKNGTVDVIFTFSGKQLAGKTMVAFEDLYHKDKKIAVHADIDDEAQTVWIPKVTTSLEDTIDSGKDALAAKDILLQDTVYYENVRVGENYEVQGYLVDKETGEPAKDDSGALIESRTSFTAKKADGKVLVTFPYSGESLNGKTLIAFEILYRNGKPVASHCILEDFDQSVFLPKIATVLKNSTGGKAVYAGENVTLIDTVNYENLLTGEHYEVEGILMDKETGKPLTDDDGKEVRAKTAFEAKEKNGTVKVQFTFPGTKIEGKSIVAFEDLFRDGKHVAVHADINDPEQTVTAASIRTTLVNEGGVKTVRAGGPVTLTDTIVYKGLVPGNTYRLKGRLMVQSTGMPMRDAYGNEVTAERTFVPETADGSAEVVFSFEMPAEVNWRLVAFETLSEGENEVARHEDLQDESQTVNVLSLRTLAAFQNGSRKAPDQKTQTIIDRISYHSLEPGVYTVRTTLMNKADGSPVTVNSVPVMQSRTVKLERASGTVSIAINVPAGAITGSAVVFEEFLKTGVDGKPVLVGEHKDLKDDSQTVIFYHSQTPAGKNTPVRTGDETNTLIWIVGALASLTVLFTVLFLLKRRGHRR